MTFRYIGSKARLVEQLADFVGTPVNKQARFVDAFCGTGAVAKVAADLGWPIWLNDNLVSAGIIAGARLISREQVDFKHLGGHAKAITALNSLSPVNGFIWREYSPASMQFIGIERRYFTQENAGRIDAIRAKIKEWKDAGNITKTEERLLIAELLSATNRVANIAGTYGCFLSKWTRQSESPLVLHQNTLRHQKVDVTITNSDVAGLRVLPEDLVYLDPPYTKRQYASYYHILETISLGDEPLVEGVAGLRPWKNKASDYCYKARALKALSSLISNLAANKILLSYSEEGHVPIVDLHKNLQQLGEVKAHVLTEIGRYRPNKVASATSSSVNEYLIVIEKNSVPNRGE